jgi:hypothetical protein
VRERTAFTGPGDDGAHGIRARRLG